MKGIVFRMLFDLIEDRFGYQVVDEIITKTNLKSGGVYTSVGTYPFLELEMIGKELELKSGIPLNRLHQIFGEYAFGIFTQRYSEMILQYNDAFHLLEHLDKSIHTEVLKLYPEADLPSFTFYKISDTEIELVYKSTRKMVDFANGLIKGCLAYYNTKANIKIQPLKSDNSHVRFLIKKI